jgi:alkylhydroperoxidase/carboxymuconolactone decarboxylase family protein YurZ
MTAVSLVESTFEAREHILARLAALVAVGAPDEFCLMNAATAADVGVTLEDVEGVLVAVAPIVGTPRVLTGSPRPWRRGGRSDRVDPDAMAGSVLP